MYKPGKKWIVSKHNGCQLLCAVWLVPNLIHLNSLLYCHDLEKCQDILTNITHNCHKYIEIKYTTIGAVYILTGKSKTTKTVSLMFSHLLIAASSNCSPSSGTDALLQLHLTVVPLVEQMRYYSSLQNFHKNLMDGKPSWIQTYVKMTYHVSVRPTIYKRMFTDFVIVG